MEERSRSFRLYQLDWDCFFKGIGTFLESAAVEHCFHCYDYYSFDSEQMNPEFSLIYKFIL